MPNLCRQEFPDYWVPPLSAPLWLSVPVLILSRTLKCAAAAGLLCFCWPSAAWLLGFLCSGAYPHLAATLQLQLDPAMSMIAHQNCCIPSVLQLSVDQAHVEAQGASGFQPCAQGAGSGGVHPAAPGGAWLGGNGRGRVGRKQQPSRGYGNASLLCLVEGVQKYNATGSCSMRRGRWVLKFQQ